jgi:predicted porin
LSDKVTVLYMLTNGIQQTEDFNDFKSHQVTVVLKPAAAITATGSFFTGQEQPDGGQPHGPDGRFQVLDAYVTYTATPALTLGLNANHTTNELNKGGAELSLTGAGAYARYQLTPAGAVGLRYEHVDDEGLFGGIDQVLHEITLTGEYKFADGFLVRGEFRRDWSNEDFFPAPTSDTPRAHQNTVLVGLVWWIGNKQGAW